jgi:hypothetical protein
MNEESISIMLSKNEAIVLFEFLSRLNEEKVSKLFVDQAEERVLWDIVATLEKQLPEPLSSNYIKILDNARKAVRDSG